MCVLGVSLRCSAWLRPGREQDFALSHPLESPGLVPALVWAVQSTGHRLGAQGVFSHSLHQSGRAVTSGELWLLPCRQAHPPGQMKCPNSCFYWPWDWANDLREKPLQIDFLVFPFSLCILGGTWGDLKALSLRWLSQRSIGSTTTHQSPSVTSL